MKTKEEYAEDFHYDLRQLLKKYHAEIQAEDHWTGYAELGSDIRMTAYISGAWDSDGNPTRHYTEINLGTFIDPKYELKEGAIK